MKLNRPLISAVYLVAVIMILMPLLEVALSVVPFRLGAPAWRFGALGVLSQAYLTPLLGAAVFIYAAILLGHRRILVFSSVVVLVAAVFMLIALPLFALDAIQMRASVRAEALRAFDRSALLAALKLLFAAIAALLFAVGAWKAARRNPHVTRTANADTPLVVRK